MGYIGKVHQSTSVPARTFTTLSGDGSVTTLNLSQEPMSASNVSVFIDGVAQTPETDYTLSGNQINFTSAVPTGSWVCAMVNGGETISSPMNGSVTTDTIVNGAITNAKINSINASKLTGTVYPALNAAAVTFGGTADIFDKNSSDPTVSSNKTLGTVWINTTTGGMFVMTDDTTDQNVWLNVGLGTSSIHNTSTYQGEIAGFTAGGNGSSGRSDIIERYSFLSDVNSVDLANLSELKYQCSGTSSSTHGYTQGGGGTGSPIGLDTVEKFSFENTNISAVVSALPAIRRQPIGISSSSFGYACGGDFPPVTSNISKYAFSNDASSGNVGDLSETRSIGAGLNDTTHGYSAGGYYHDNVPFPYNRIDRFAFASDGTAVSVGTLNMSRYGCAGSSSTTHGYVAGGYVSGLNVNTDTIDRFAFASSVTSADIGSLVQIFSHGSDGTSSTTHGYIGGSNVSPNIQKYSFSNSTTSSDVAQSISGRTHSAGTQY
jgi:hypothetical protein